LPLQGGDGATVVVVGLDGVGAGFCVVTVVVLEDMLLKSISACVFDAVIPLMTVPLPRSPPAQLMWASMQSVCQVFRTVGDQASK
jgi:hypothetical protein